MTLGEYRVGLSFNPSGNPKVDAIKKAAATSIDMLEAERDPSFPEQARLLDLAQGLIEDAAMWGVKAVTKVPPA
jgi:hypothetical protein